MTRVRVLLALAFLLALPASGRADWIRDYEDGTKAAGAGNWEVVVEKMTAAIGEKGRENARERTHGTIFIAYHPFYYRGVAYFHLGRFEEAIRDLQRATGQGPVKLGTPESFLSRAESQLAMQSQPVEPPPTRPPPTTTQPTVTEPPVPTVDPNLNPTRNRARQAIADAKSRQEAARRARADSQAEFSQALNLLLEAESGAVGADTTADWARVEDRASKATLSFNLAITKAQIAAQQKPAQPTPPVTTAATNEAIARMRTQVRSAVQAYFSGDFSTSVREFDDLTRRDGDNALLWAFLGASHFYNWYLGGEANENEKQAAVEAFRQARRSNRRLRLNESYFPQRVRNFYETVRVD
ncbi:MAG TPA: tetratricopeptide repeat protein [Thermoanaerobaculia bacterium]|nr:tetratricopeptide repeat protein [Thermoanaerobaculia bacterium]